MNLGFFRNGVLGLCLWGCGVAWAADPASPCRLTLPPVLYAVATSEVNLYFDNVVLTPPGTGRIFEVTCDKGRQLNERWTWTPKDEETGDVPLVLEVRNADDKVVASGQTVVRVVARNAGAQKPVRLLCVGDSLTHNGIYTAELLKLCSGPEQPALKLLGTHHPKGAVEGNVHEGYGGWRYQDFVERYTDKPVPENQPNQRSSPFVFVSPQGPVFDVPRYVKESCDGVPPDFITVLLGANDMARVTDAQREEALPKILGYADRLIAGLRAAAPQARIGLLPPLPPVASQDAFGANYGLSIKWWTYRKNQHRMVEGMLARYGGREKEGIYLVPALAMIDTVYGYPHGPEEPASARATRRVSRASNALHPDVSGYLQVADAIYDWLKAMLARDKG